MRRWMLLPVLAILFAAGGGAAQGHECTYSGEEPDTGDQVECHETPVVPNWRDGNYVPLFDLRDREDPDQRKETQRWRDCQGYDASGRYYNNQFCLGQSFGTSFFPGPGGDGPNEVHVFTGGQHCFLFEFAHQCEHHDARHGESVHDAHGGAIFVDVCGAENAENKYCDDGMSDTGAGLIVMDHNACGTIVPVVACTDEYHVLYPFREGYTEEQMADSADYIQWIVANPDRYLCGKPQYRGDGNPICPGEEASSPGASKAGVAADRGAHRASVAPTRVTGPTAGAGGKGARLDVETLAVRGSSRQRRGAAESSSAALLTVLAGLLALRRVRRPARS